MKSLSRSFFFIITLPILSCGSGSAVESLKTLGTEPFDASRWARAGEQERGTMIYDFIHTNTPITDKDRNFIIGQLGENTGYYDYDHFPAYYVGPKPINSNAKAYLVAFTVDHETERVTGVHIEPPIK
jgi:hypothetical protein